MKKVLDQYIAHAERAKRKGIMSAYGYYLAAAERIQALINAPKPAWVDLQFGSKSAF